LEISEVELQVPQVDAHSTDNVLVVGLASGYDFGKVRVFAESLRATSGGHGKQTELVLAGLKEKSGGGPVQDALLMREKLGISVVNWEELASAEYFGLLQHPDWAHLQLQQTMGCLQPLQQGGLVRECQSEAETFADYPAAMERWMEGKPFVRIRHFIYFLVILNRLHYGPQPHIVLTADIRDVVFQADVRSLLHEHASYRSWYKEVHRKHPHTARKQAPHRRAWMGQPALLVVAEEGCPVLSNVNGGWLTWCFGDDIVKEYYPNSWRSMNTGTVLGTARAMLIHERWMTALSSVVQCKVNDGDQQFHSLLTRKLYQRGGSSPGPGMLAQGIGPRELVTLDASRFCIPGHVPNATRNFNVPSLCINDKELGAIQEVHAQHYVDGGIMTMHCFKLGGMGILEGGRPHYDHNHLADYTLTMPPVLQSVASSPSLDKKRVSAIKPRMPAIVHQYDRVPELLEMFKRCSVPANVTSPCDFKDTVGNFERLRSKAGRGFVKLG
jgi:hypothetical protein